jgi:nitroreductase
MEFIDIVKKNRSCRRFDENKAITKETLTYLVNLARLTPSAQNLQPLKYIIAAEPDKCNKIFRSLLWAGYLTEWAGPEPGERPSAYIIILSDKEISKAVKWDHGIAAQTILLGAVSEGFAGCIIGSANKYQLRSSMKIPDQYEIELVIALGYPKEKIIIEDIENGESIRYYRDPEGNHHVPKRKLDDIILDIDINSRY